MPFRTLCTDHFLPAVPRRTSAFHVPPPIAGKNTAVKRADKLMNGFPSWTSWYGVHYVPDWAEGSACLIICHADALLSRIPIYCAIIVRSLNKECCPRRRHENNRLFLLFRKVTRRSCLAILVLLSNWENRTRSRALLLEPCIAILRTAKTGHSFLSRKRWKQLVLMKSLVWLQWISSGCNIYLQTIVLERNKAGGAIAKRFQNELHSHDLTKQNVLWERNIHFFSSTWG